MTAEAIVGRCLDALEILAAEPKGLALTALSQRLGLDKSGTYRLLSELQADGYVAQEPESQYYRLSMRLPTLGFRYLGSTGIIEACKPALDALATKTGELVRMTVAERDQLTWVARAQGATTRLRFDPVTGGEVRLHTTASARIWLASLPEATALALVEAAGIEHSLERGPNAPRTLTDFARRLREARRDGFAIAVDEDEPGMSAVAVSIPHPEQMHPVLGTLSVAGPTLRMDRARLVSLVPDLRTTASELSNVWPIQARDMGVVPGSAVNARDSAQARKANTRQLTARGKARGK